MSPRPYARSLVLILLVFSLPGAAGAQPSFGFEPQAVSVSGLSPGAAVAVIGVGRDLDGFMPVRLEVWELAAADAAGVARVELRRPLPAWSVWAAVDLGAGTVATGAPADAGVREAPLPPEAIPGSLRRLERDRPALSLLWVRPAGSGPGTAGAWGGAITDGGGRDGDGVEDRRLSVLLDSLQPLGASPANPGLLAAGDVLVAIDPESLEIHSARLGR